MANPLSFRGSYILFAAEVRIHPQFCVASRTEKRHQQISRRCYTMFVFVYRGYMLRFHKAGLRPGDTVYIIDGDWFKQWRKVTGYEVPMLYIDD